MFSSQAVTLMNASSTVHNWHTRITFALLSRNLTNLHSVNIVNTKRHRQNQSRHLLTQHSLCTPAPGSQDSQASWSWCAWTLRLSETTGDIFKITAQTIDRCWSQDVYVSPGNASEYLTHLEKLKGRLRTTTFPLCHWRTSSFPIHCKSGNKEVSMSIEDKIAFD